jgi:hypothetical protein
LELIVAASNCGTISMSSATGIDHRHRAAQLGLLARRRRIDVGVGRVEPALPHLGAEQQEPRSPVTPWPKPMRQDVAATHAISS